MVNRRDALLAFLFEVDNTEAGLSLEGVTDIVVSCVAGMSAFGVISDLLTDAGVLVVLDTGVGTGVPAFETIPRVRDEVFTGVETDADASISSGMRSTAIVSAASSSAFNGVASLNDANSPIVARLAERDTRFGVLS